MKIIIGLGNPGKEYAKTKHNMGWMYIEHLQDKYGFSVEKKECDSLTGQFTIDDKKILFVKPQTYMNLSGNAVQKIKSWNKVENDDILIVYDDIDIDFGQVRYRLKGKPGTHNGMKNIVQMLSSQDIPRIRLGIGGTRYENQDLKDFVLQRLSKEELEKLKEIFAVADEKLLEFIDK